MKKQWIAVLLSVLMVLLSVPVFATTAAGEVWYSEEFSSYPANSAKIKNFTVSTGLDARVLDENGNKVFFSRAWGDPVIFSLTLPSAEPVKSIFSARIKMTGKEISGKLFNMISGEKKLALLTLNEDRSIRLTDGKIVGSVPDGIYKTYTIAVDWEQQVYDVYIDKKCIVHNWFLPSGFWMHPQTVEFQVDDGETETDIYVDNIRVYEGDELPWQRTFPAEKVNNEMLEFTPTESIDSSVKILTDMEFDDSIAMVKTYSQHNGEVSPKGAVFKWESGNDGNGCLRVVADEKVVGGGFFDVTNNDLRECMKYVYDVRFKINSLTGNAGIGILDAKNMDSKWRLGYDISTGGSLSSHGAGKSIGNIPKGEWVRFSVVYNIPAGKAEVYINGELAVSHAVPTDNYPVTIRVDVLNQAGSTFDVSFDWIRIYTGKTLQDDSAFVSEGTGGDDNSGFNSYSVMDPKDKLEAALKGRTVFMTTNDALYVNGEKTIAADDAKKVRDIGGNLMIPQPLLEEIAKESVVYDKDAGTISVGLRSMKAEPAPAEENGIVYFPLRAVAEQLLRKKVIWDNRGFAVLSDDELEKTSEYHYLDRHILFHPIDLIYRYMQFDNPTGAQMTKTLVGNFPNKQHPRILYTADDVKYIQGKVQSSPEWEKAYKELISEADEWAKEDYSYFATLEASEKQLAARFTFQAAIEDLAEAYLITEDPAYAAKGIEMMLAMAQWQDMAWQTANLTTGAWAAGMAIGYDSFYNYMAATDEGKEKMKIIREAVLRLPFADQIADYQTGVGPYWITLQDNFSGVVGGGLLMLTLAMADEEDMQPQTNYLMENLMKSLETAVGLYYPDGGYYEGVGYSEYLLENFVMALGALFNCCGTDYGFGNAKGFAKAGDPFTYLQSTDSHMQYHDDGSSGYINDPSREFFAWRYNDPISAEVARVQKTLGGHAINLRAMFYYSRAVTDRGVTPDISQLPLDRYFYGVDTGGFTNSREISDPAFVGFHAGWTNMPHDMLDLGSFVFESDNVIWARDLGSDSYSIPDYFGLKGYNIYRKRPEGENCIVLNPKEDVENYYGQELGVQGTLTSLETDKPLGAFAAFDLTPAYQRDASKYIRGYYFGDGRNSLVVQDELTVNDNTELYWFMHTAAKIEIISNTKAKLISNTGKTLTVEVYSNIEGYTLKEMPAEPLPTSPKVAGQSTNAAFRKLAVYAPSVSGDAVIAVKLSPDNGKYEQTPLIYTPIDEWTIPDGELPQLAKFSGIYANGELISGFMPGGRNYTIDLPYGTEQIPQITATSDMGRVTVKQTQTFSENTEITLEVEGQKPVVCTVSYNVSSERPITVREKISAVTPTVGQTGTLIAPVRAYGMTIPEADNGPKNMTDDSLKSYYAQGEIGAWFEIDMGEVVEFDGVSLAFYLGNERKVNYDILYSMDGTNFTKVFSGQSTGETVGYESLKIPGKARYIRLIGNGNTQGSAYTSIGDFRVFQE